MDCKKIVLQVKFDPTAIKWWAEYLLSNSLVPSIEQLRHSTLILPFQSTNIIKTLQQNHASAIQDAALTPTTSMVSF
jgi:hypothetical protein